MTSTSTLHLLALTTIVYMYDFVLHDVVYAGLRLSSVLLSAPSTALLEQCLSRTKIVDDLIRFSPEQRQYFHPKPLGLSELNIAFLLVWTFSSPHATNNTNCAVPI